jgi:hypothetical protein
MRHEPTKLTLSVASAVLERALARGPDVGRLGDRTEARGRMAATPRLPAVLLASRVAHNMKLAPFHMDGERATGGGLTDRQRCARSGAGGADAGACEPRVSVG